VSVASPILNAVTTPAVEMVAMFELDVVQLTARPLSELPCESSALAVSDTLEPEDTVAACGTTLSAAMCEEATFTLAVSATLDALATIFAKPLSFPVARPVAETVT